MKRPIFNILVDWTRIINTIKRHKLHRGETSKYTPHQGKQECARRIRQR